MNQEAKNLHYTIYLKNILTECNKKIRNKLQVKLFILTIILTINKH